MIRLPRLTWARVFRRFRAAPTQPRSDAEQRAARDYPALTHLAQAYLHQDFDLEYADDAVGAVDDFLRGACELAELIPAEVARAFVEFPSEEATRAFVLDDLDSSYLVEADGLTYRGWLQSVTDRAHESGY